MPLQSTLRITLLLITGIATIAFGLVHAGPVAGQEGGDTQEKIENAMAAAPASLAENATILDYEVDDAGNFIVLREGSNGWSCFPDTPGTPTDDPMCFDETWMDWITALVAGEEPSTQTLGLAYMLLGGSDASNTDPMATEPAPGDEWVVSPPHVMILLPGDLAETGLSTEHGAGVPWIMWAGTPYEHIMMPVTDDMGDMGDMMEATPAP